LEERSSTESSWAERGLQVLYSPCQEAEQTEQNAKVQSMQIARRSAGGGSGGSEIPEVEEVVESGEMFARLVKGAFGRRAGP